MRLVIDSGIDRVLEGLGSVQNVCRIRGERVVEIAKQIAPVDTGAYQDSIRLEHFPFHVEVVADISYAGYLEFGTGDTPAFHTLETALETAANE